MDIGPFQRNQRKTQQRQVILEELQKLTSHPTASVLHKIVAKRLPRISLGTVYRNLELLTRSGIIQKLQLDSGEARFDGNITRHDHLRCVRCGCVDDILTPPLAISRGDANDWRGYQILGHRLEFFGICPQCRGVNEIAAAAEGATAMTTSPSG
jgi:Fur family ferric uptake transcriptional regulator